MKNLLKSIIFIIVCCMLPPLIFSCGGNNTGNKADTSAAASETSAGETASPQNSNNAEASDLNLRENTPDSLPANLNFNGEEIRILHRENATNSNYIGSTFVSSEISVDSEIGEVVNDAIYRRNKKVEERLNIKITPIAIPGDWDQKDSFLKTVRNSVKSGSDDFDLIAGYSYYIASLAPDGVLYNLKKVNYLKPDAVWWSASCAEQMTIANKLYYITGDAALTLLQNMYVVYFNKKVAQDNGIDNPYQTVLNGDWTLDKMIELSKGLYKDINGDGKQDEGDMYGLGTTTGNYVDALFNAFDQPIIKKDADGVPQLALNTPKMAEMVTKIYDFFYNSGSAYAISEYLKDANTSVDNMFIDNRLLFMNGTLGSNEVFRAMNSDYGIIPYPKWNKEQPAYYTSSQNAYTLFCIPATCSKTDAVGATLEALCAESYRTVTPAYYEIALKKKYSRDDETSQMLDIIRSGLTFDFGGLNSINLQDILIIFRNLMTEKKTDFASRYEQSAKKWQSLLDKLVASYEDLP